MSFARLLTRRSGLFRDYSPVRRLTAVSLLLEGKRAFMTGGTRGIGAAICEVFAREGADVAFNYSNRDDLATEIRQRSKRMGAKR